MTKLIVAWLVLFCVSCACWSAAHRDEPQCVARREQIDCAAKEVVAKLPALYGIVTFILSAASSTPDWQSLLMALETAAGRDQVACTVLKVQTEAAYQVRTFTTVKSTAPDVEAAAEAYIHARDFKFKGVAFDGGVQ
jgi:hypothetical protein